MKKRTKIDYQWLREYVDALLCPSSRQARADRSAAEEQKWSTYAMRTEIDYQWLREYVDALLRA